MDEIIAHIEELSKLSPYIKLYRNFDPKIILKHYCPVKAGKSVFEIVET